MARPFFWLHAKKCAGQSLRVALKPHYREIDRERVRPFSEISPEERNDWVNNYRQELGEYDYRRMMFVRDVAYTPGEFGELFKFTFVRDPFSRAVSMWRYLGRPRLSFRHRDNVESFKGFLRQIPYFWDTKDLDRSLATHTRPVWPDITDERGELLVDFIGRVENYKADLATVCERIGIAEPAKVAHVNRGGRRRWLPFPRYYDPEAVVIVRRLFGEDVEGFGYEAPSI